MVELDTHRIVDILESRDSEEVAKWLQTYPNITVISRDGAQIYANASTRAHPSAIQVSDRFHLVKNLCDVVSKLIQREFPSRVAIPATCSSPEMQILYNTANQAERIQFAKRKRAEGYTISDIALMLHSSATTISRYLSYCEDDLPINTSFARQRQHEQAIQRKKEANIMGVYLKCSPAEEPIYQFLDRKRAEGKPFYVYMTAGANKFLRRYFAKVRE